MNAGKLSPPIIIKPQWHPLRLSSYTKRTLRSREEIISQNLKPFLNNSKSEIDLKLGFLKVLACDKAFEQHKQPTQGLRKASWVQFRLHTERPCQCFERWTSNIHEKRVLALVPSSGAAIYLCFCLSPS